MFQPHAYYNYGESIDYGRVCNAQLNSLKPVIMPPFFQKEKYIFAIIMKENI